MPESLQSIQWLLALVLGGAIVLFVLFVLFVRKSVDTKRGTTKPTVGSPQGASKSVGLRSEIAADAKLQRKPVLRVGMRVQEAIAMLGRDYTRASLGEALGNARGVLGGGVDLERGMAGYIWDHSAGRYQILVVDGVVTDVREQPK